MMYGALRTAKKVAVKRELQMERVIDAREISIFQDALK